MLYFSEFYGKLVRSEDNTVNGFLIDLIFLHEDHPAITKIVIKTSINPYFIIPFSATKKLNSAIIVQKSFESQPQQDNELSIAKQLLDRQIIDLVGNKVVRVNDVLIQDKPSAYVAGIDIGLRGIARRLGIYPLLHQFSQKLNYHLPDHYLSWSDIQNLELTNGNVKLKKREEKLSRIRAEDLADYLEKTTIKNVRRFLKSIDQTKAAEVIGNLNLNYQSALFQDFHPETAAKFLTLVDPDEAVDILFAVPAKRRGYIMELLPIEKRQELEYLMDFSTTPVGGMITSEFVVIPSTTTVREVVAKIKKETTDFSFLPTIYVVNPDSQLVGFFSLHELLLQDPGTPVYRFMTQNPIVIHLTTPIEIVLKKMLKYKLSALPVVAKNKHIVGMITIDDMSEYMLNQFNWL